MEAAKGNVPHDDYQSGYVVDSRLSKAQSRLSRRHYARGPKSSPMLSGAVLLAILAQPHPLRA